MRDWKVGDILVLQNNSYMAAEIGALAVIEDPRHGLYVYVKWICDKSRGQMDGGYPYDYFELHEICRTPLWEALS